MNPQVDLFLEQGCMRCSLGGTPQCKVHTWPAELRLLRSIVLSCNLVEDVKWSYPCYTLNNKNVLMLGPFKQFCSISFFKGAAIEDTHNILQRAGENTQAARLLKFTNLEQIEQQKDIIKSYILQAIEIEKMGIKLESKPLQTQVPIELEDIFNEFPDFKAAFYALTPGRQRGYLMHFAQPKQSQTKITRIKNSIDNIMKGKGIHDDYKR